MALLSTPSLLFLDEPSNSMDPVSRQNLYSHLRSMRDTAILLITHRVDEAEKICDRIAILDSGRILAQGSPTEIRQKGVTASNAEPTMEDAFIAVIEAARAAAPQAHAA